MSAVQLYEYKDGLYVTSEDAKQYLRDQIGSDSFVVVAIVGTYRKGKSTFLNILMQGTSPGPFTVSAQSETCTKGILAAYDSTKKILYLDVEGSDAPSMAKEKWCEYRMNALAMILSSTLMYWHWEGAISSNLSTLSSLCVFSERLRALNSHDAATRLPAFIWLFRNWDDSGIDIEPTKEYVYQQIDRVDPTITTYFDKFNSFQTVDLPRPIHGKMTVTAFSSKDQFVPEYLSRLDMLNSQFSTLSQCKIWTTSGFISLCEGLEKVVNEDDFVPDIVLQACQVSREAMIREAVLFAMNECTKELNVLALPMEDTTLVSAVAEVTAHVREKFRRNVVGIIASEDEAVALVDLDSKLQECAATMTKRNEDRSVIVCQGLLAPLQEQYLELMRGLTLPLPTSEIETAHEQARNEVLQIYDQRAQGLKSVQNNYRDALTGVVDRFHSEKTKENLYKSELLCEKCVNPAMDEFLTRTAKIKFPLNDKALDTHLQVAMQEAKECFERETRVCADFIVMTYQKKLVEKLQLDVNALQEKNLAAADATVKKYFPSIVDGFHERVGKQLKSAVMPKDALDQLFKEHSRQAMEEFDAVTSLFALNDDVAEGDSFASDGACAKMTSARRAELGQILSDACKEYECSNNSRAAEICTKLVDVSHSFYEKNMKLLTQPISKQDLLNAHFENELCALENFLSKAVGTLPEIQRYEQALRQKITKSSERIQQENCWIVNEGLLMKRGMFIHSWQLRYFVLRDGVLKYFDVATVQKQMRGNIPIASIEVVEYCDAHPSKKVVDDLEKEAKESGIPTTPQAGTSSTTSGRSPGPSPGGDGDPAHRWGYGFMVKAAKTTLYLSAETERAREVWVLTLRNACNMET